MAQGIPGTSADIRAKALDPLKVTPAQTARLRGQECARCGSRNGLRDAGYAYTACKRSGRLGWAVKVCGSCPSNWRGR
ncbi:hypothetical protein ACFXKW_20975 [Streptomyces sp. NPDC059193]|uniref:hypothetical protein n=1 Tax=Streptomyces sp. NPDC059193 TaxID=3346763 RepID=UPI00368C6618